MYSHVANSVLYFDESEGFFLPLNTHSILKNTHSVCSLLLVDVNLGHPFSIEVYVMAEGSDNFGDRLPRLRLPRVVLHVILKHV
jgi:hypothetical protein